MSGRVLARFNGWKPSGGGNLKGFCPKFAVKLSELLRADPLKNTFLSFQLPLLGIEYVNPRAPFT